VLYPPLPRDLDGAADLDPVATRLRFLRAGPATGGQALVLMGESLGGSVALVLAAEDTSVRAVVEDSGFATGQWALRDALDRWVPGLGGLAPLVRAAGRALVGADPGALDALPASAQLTGRPVLLIHGAADRRVRPAQAEALWRAGHGQHRLWRVPAAGHARAWQLEPRLYQARVLSFLEGALARP
jgi:pimeloyl-ACP methyl ester carboxylesterase